MFSKGTLKVGIDFFRKQVKDMVHTFQVNRTDQSLTHEILVNWKPPQTRWTKLNTNGAVKGV